MKDRELVLVLTNKPKANYGHYFNNYEKLIINLLNLKLMRHTKITVILTMMLFINVLFLQAQEGCFGIGHKSNDNNTGMSVYTTSDGGIFMTGYASAYGEIATNLYVVRFASNGDTLWTRTMGGQAWDYGFDGIETSDGGFLAVGSTQSYGTFVHDFYVVRFDSQGDTLWTRVIDGAGDDRNDEALAVAETPEGGFAIAGYSYIFGGYYPNAYVIKLNADGDVLWTRIVGGGSGEKAEDIIVTNDNGLVVVGGGASYSVASSDMYIFKLDEDGDLLWTRTIGGSRNDYAYAVAETADGRLVVAGSTNSYGEGATGFLEATDAYIVMFDSDGDTIWTRTIGGVNNEQIRDIIITDDGYILAAGHSATYGHGFMDAYVIKMNMEGDVVWTNTYGDNNTNMAFGLTEVAQNRYLLIGRTHYSAYGRDVFLAWLDGNGNSCCKNDYGGIVHSGGITGSGGIAGTGGATIDSGGEMASFFAKDTLCLGLADIQIKKHLSSIVLYPNPTSDILNIMIETNITEPLNISLYSIQGQKLWEAFIRHDEVFTKDVSELNSGIYIIKVHHKEGINTRKLIVK